MEGAFKYELPAKAWRLLHHGDPKTKVWTSPPSTNPGNTMPEEYWNLVEPIWDLISIDDGPERFLIEFGRAPERSRVLFAAHWILAPEAVEAFRVLGMPRTAAVLLDAMAFFGDPYPREREVRQRVFAQFYEKEGEAAIPIRDQEDLFAELLEEENGGFWTAADMYATND